MPGTDINFPGVEDEILKKISIMSDQVIEKLELLKTDKALQSDQFQPKTVTQGWDKEIKEIFRLCFGSANLG